MLAIYMDPPKGEITLLLGKIRLGDRDAESRLISIVYSELRRLAGYYMRRERADHTLQPTALVHEAYLKLVEQNEVDYRSRAHFFAYAAQLMRNILVSHARAVKSEKRNGARKRVPLESVLICAEDDPDEFLALDDALNQLARRDVRQAQIIELHFFGGLSLEETASFLEISTRTVKRDWRMARAWLHAELADAKHSG
jgi:RNA polymerase sigma-70 factor (ECF subfamily)